MGWTGYGIYDGDGTQTCHYHFLKWAKVSKSDDEIQDWLHLRKTKLPKDKISFLEENINLILKKMPKKKPFQDEYIAIEWQMLAALLLDNGIKIPKEIYEPAKISTEYLMGEHASFFNSPGTRRANLKRFLNKLEANKK